MGHVSLFTLILGDVLFLRFFFTFHRFCIGKLQLITGLPEEKKPRINTIGIHCVIYDYYY